MNAIGKCLNVYHFFSSYRWQIEVFSSVCFIALSEMFHSREKKGLRICWRSLVYMSAV